MIRLETVLDSWKTVRQDTAQAVEDFPAGEMDFKPVSDVMTFGEIARHILVAGYGITGMLLDGVENLATPQFREDMQKYAAELAPTPDAGSLAAALRQSLERRTAQLAAQPAAFFDHVITRFDGLRVTRLETVQMAKEHELTHRAQLFLYLRMKGIVPATTRRRLAKQQTA
ncbi:MAG TPA: DinB family protein [Bryobacteraceae bacterium]|nr:DinB family protein [Bryobacteraceae bacterium]